MRLVHLHTLALGLLLPGACSGLWACSGDDSKPAAPTSAGDASAASDAQACTAASDCVIPAPTPIYDPWYVVYSNPQCVNGSCSFTGTPTCNPDISKGPNASGSTLTGNVDPCGSTPTPAGPSGPPPPPPGQI